MLIQHSNILYECFVVRGGSKINNGHPPKSIYHVFKRNWTTCLKSDVEHCRLNRQHHNGVPCPIDHLMSTRILTLMINKIFIRAPEIMKNMATGRFVFANHLVVIVFRILEEVGAERTVSD